MLINDASITGSLIVNASSSFQNIAVSGNILPGTNNVYDLGSVDKYFKEIFVSTSSINFVGGDGIVTASLSANVLNSLIQNTGSANSSISSINTFTGSFSASVSSSIATISSSVTTTITTLSSSVSTSFSSSAATVTSLSSSLTSVNTTQNNRLSSIESATGSYSKLSGGNTFTGVQIISGSTFIAGDLIVQGSSSIQYISASSVSIGTNTINLNTNTPAVRFAGISIFDSGSNAQTASIFWDGLCNKFIYSNPSSVGYSGGMLISGPRNTGSMGDESGLTCNTLATSIGSDHISSSAIFHDPTTTCFYNSTTINSSGVLTSTNLVGTICARNGVVSGSSQVVYTSLSSIPAGIVSGSSQVDLTATTNYASGILTRLNTVGVFSGSAQVSLSGFTSTNLSEGTNLYYTDARVKTKLNAETVISGSGQVTIASTTGFGTYINQALLTTSSPTFSAVSATTFTGALSGNASTVSNGVYTNANNTMTSGNKIVIQNSQDGGSTRGIFMWNSSDSNWGIYMATSGAGKSLGDSTAATGLDGRTDHAIRFRVASSTTQIGFLWENSDNTALMQLQPNTGTLLVKNRIVLGIFPNSTTNTGEAWIGRASDRNQGTMTVQLGGNSASSRSFEVVDYAWSVVLASVSSAGTFTASGDITAYSDVRIKENILNITDPLSKVLRLRGVSYNRTDIEDKSTKMGFIAQEVEKIVPEVVTYNKEQDRYGVSYGNMTALLVEAIKEQQIKIDNLTIEVENLKKPKGL